MPCPRMPQGGTKLQAEAGNKTGLTERRGGLDRKPRHVWPKAEAHQAGNRKMPRLEKQRAAMADAMRCNGRCSTLR